MSGGARPPRIPLLSVEASRAAAERAGVPVTLAELNVFRLLLRRPATAKAISDLLLSLLFGGELDDRLRELVIMRIGWVTGSDYEWTQHWKIARARFGLRPEELLAVRDWQRHDVFGAAEQAVLAATDETLATGTIAAATWARCEAHLDADARVELVVALGAWRLISQLTRSLEIPLEDGVASWPPDGRRPAAAE
jgi:alkylhydroperoxidase family enzyme